MAQAVLQETGGNRAAGSRLGRSALLLGLLVAATSAMLALVAVVVGGRLPRSELAYVSYRLSQSDIILFDALRHVEHNLTGTPAYDLNPAWSPDGSQMAFVSDRDGGLQIFLMDANGEQIRRLTPPGRAFEAPRWSPDGNRLAFVARGTTGADVFVVNADGTGFQQVSGETTELGSIMLELGMDAPAAGGTESPVDGEAISFHYALETGWGLYMGESQEDEGDFLASLGPIVSELSASWSPDGQAIAYLSWADGAPDLYLIAPSPGSPARQITRDSFYESSPVWRPAQATS